MSSPHDRIEEMKYKIESLSYELEARNDQLKKEKQTNHELTVFNYVLIGLFVIITVISITWYNEKEQYKKDIVMVVKDRADWEHKWTDFNKSFIPETALPRCADIEAIYNEERK
jgi:hypothetical protein